MKTAVERLADAIGYPERVPEGGVSFVFQVDGTEVLAEETGGRLRLLLELPVEESQLPRFASYAAGRMLREEAVLSYGMPGNDNAMFLWQDAPVTAIEYELSRLFETFADSCDWWRARVEELRASDQTKAMSQEMVIMP